MKKQNVFHLLAVIVLLAAGSAYAQMSRSLAKANVPFDFRAGDITLPAGEYTIDKMNTTGTLMVSGKASHRIFVNSNAAEAPTASSSTNLVFHHYGNTYFLYQVWVKGESSGRQFPPTRLEKEVASNARPNSVAVLAEK